MINTKFSENEFMTLPSGSLSVEVEYKAKSSYPLVKSSSPEGTIGPKINPPIYSPEQNTTWEMLMEKHGELIQSGQYLCSEYKSGLKKIDFSRKKVSELKSASEAIKTSTGWEIIRVEGLVSPENFFKLLSNKVFPCTDFIRHRDEIDYTPAPDTFHDQIGHLPMITDKRFADFFHLFGLAGTRAKSEEEIEWFNRIYWFTVEFGLLNPTVATDHYDPKQSVIYGAGIASSCGEMIHSLSSKVKKLPFDLEIVINTDFNIHHMQNTLFEISSFDALEHAFRTWAIKHGFLDP